MVSLETIPLSAAGVVRFAPGGYHLMFESPDGPVDVGRRIRVTLQFADGAQISAQFVVRAPLNSAG
jgi:copper(I)-binding protein